MHLPKLVATEMELLSEGHKSGTVLYEKSAIDHFPYKRKLLWSIGSTRLMYLYRHVIASSYVFLGRIAVLRDGLILRIETMPVQYAAVCSTKIWLVRYRSMGDQVIILTLSLHVLSLLVMASFVELGGSDWSKSFPALIMPAIEIRGIRLTDGPNR